MTSVTNSAGGGGSASGAGGSDIGGSDASGGHVALTITIDGAEPSGPLTRVVGDTAELKWSAHADSCRYDGSVLPSAVSGWSGGGEACSSAASCAAGQTLPLSFAEEGEVYTFQLDCTQHNGPEPATSVTKSITIQVTDAGGCVAPGGLTRQMAGTISMGGGQNPEDTDYSRWLTTLGYVLSSKTYWTWPGAQSNDVKYYIKKGQYASFEFAVPSDYPFYTSIDVSPYGALNFSNTSAITYGVYWTVSLSEECGGFIPPSNPSDPKNSCYKEVSGGNGSSLYWAVTPPGSPVANVCNLERGKRYYLNLVAAHLGTPGESTCPDSDDSRCKINMANVGFKTRDTYQQTQP